MKTSQILANFRTAYALYSDDIRWTDRYLISTFNIARAVLIRRRTDREKLDPSNWVGFCVQLCIDKRLECPCLKQALCHALVSKVYIPKFISTKSNAGIVVTNGHGDILERWSPRDANASIYNPALKGREAFWLENYKGKIKLVIWNTLDWTEVYVSMLPSSLDDIMELTECVSNGTVTCDDWTMEEFPIDVDLIYDLYKLTNDMLIPQFRDADDEVNDNVDKLSHGQRANNIRPGYTNPQRGQAPY